MMYELFVNWIGSLPSLIDSDLTFMFVCLASLFILNFLLDFFRFIMYLLVRR